MADKIGRFEVVRLLGRGGMAEVYLADDSDADRQVAIKLLPQHLLHDPQFKARFEREARVLAKLSHPNIVPMYEFGYHGEQPYMVNPHMAGGSLEDLLKTKGKLSVAQAVAILEPMCAALEAAHKKGIIHRDLKPGNILFDEEGRVYVADFGIAKLVEGSTGLTGTAVVGTPAYMSPEQFEANKELDGRSDQYSLAIMLFEMLSGQTPFKADTWPSMMHMHLVEPPPSIRKLRKDVPEGLATAIQQALSKKPAERFASLAALLAAVKEAVGPEAAEPVPSNPAPKEAARKPVLAEKPRAKTTRFLKEDTAGTPRELDKQPKRGRSAWIYIGAGSIVALAICGLLFVLPGVLSNVLGTGTSTSTATTARVQNSTVVPQPTLAATQEIPVFREASLLWRTTQNSHVQDVAFSPDGQSLAGASMDGRVYIWSAEDGDLQQTLRGHSSLVDAVAFSPDGELLASGSLDGTIRIWRLSDGVTLRTLTGHTERVNSVVFSPDGELLASGSDDNAIRIWSTADGELQRTLTGHTGDVYSVTFSPNEDLLASSAGGLGASFGEADYTVRIWNVSSGELLRTLSGHTDSVRWVAFSPDGQLLGSVSIDGTVRLWRVDDGELQQTLAGDSFVAFSPDGQLLASASGLALDLWRISDGTLVQSLLHTNSVNAAAFSSDGRALASVTGLTGIEGTAQLWQLTYAESVAGNEEASCTNIVSYVADVTIPDGQQIPAGTPFTKTWAIRNAGTCNWSTAYQFVFSGGDQMGGPLAIAIDAVPAGETTNISVDLTAPNTPGIYRGDWTFVNANGEPFGSLYVEIEVP